MVAFSDWQFCYHFQVLRIIVCHIISLELHSCSVDQLASPGLFRVFDSTLLLCEMVCTKNVMVFELRWGEVVIFFAAVSAFFLVISFVSGAFFCSALILGPLEL